MPWLAPTLHEAWNGVVHPATLLASVSLGQFVADAPLTVSQNTEPGETTHTCVDASHESVMPPLPHVNVPVHGPE